MTRGGEEKKVLKPSSKNLEVNEKSLIAAAKQGYWKKVKKIIKDYPVNINYKSDKNSDPLLIIACERNNLEIVQLALNNKADVTLTGRNRWTPLMEVAMNGKIPYIKTLLEHGASIDLGREDRALTPLMSACTSLRKEAAIFLIQNGANFHLKANSVSYKGTISEILKSDCILKKYAATNEMIKIIETAETMASSIKNLLKYSNLTPEILDKNLQSIKDLSAPFSFNPSTLVLDEEGRNINSIMPGIHLKNRAVLVMEKVNKNLTRNLGEVITNYLETKDQTAIALVAKPKLTETKSTPNPSPIVVESQTLEINIDKNNLIIA